MVVLDHHDDHDDHQDHDDHGYDHDHIQERILEKRMCSCVANCNLHSNGIETNLWITCSPVNKSKQIQTNRPAAQSTNPATLQSTNPGSAKKDGFECLLLVYFRCHKKKLAWWRWCWWKWWRQEAVWSVGLRMRWPLPCRPSPLPFLSTGYEQDVDDDGFLVITVIRRPGDFENGLCDIYHFYLSAPRAWYCLFQASVMIFILIMTMMMAMMMIMIMVIMMIRKSQPIEFLQTIRTIFRHKLKWWSIN